MVVTNGSIPFTTLEATTSSEAYNDSQCSGTYLGEMHADIWFSYAATCTGTLTVSTCNTATFDTDLVVYQGTCSNLIQIEPGQAQTIRLLIIANKPGTEMFILSLSDADAVDENEHEIELTAEGEVITDSTSSGSSVVIWSSFVVIIIGLILIAFIITQRKPTATNLTSIPKQIESPAFVPVVAPVAAPAAEAFSANPEPVSAVAVQCWSCMKNISSESALACPGCGARYHSKEHGCGVENLQKCRGCQSPVSGFVKG